MTVSHLMKRGTWCGMNHIVAIIRRSKQNFLQLWDEIDLSHEKSKQEYGPELCVIGFLINPNLMRISMDDEDRTRLIQHVTVFIAIAPGGTRQTLREFQQLAGWINWSFNVFPLLKPALSNVYAKLSGKTDSYAKIYVNKAVVQDLKWFMSHVQRSDGIFLFKNIDWQASQADIIVMDNIPSLYSRSVLSV